MLASHLAHLESSGLVRLAQVEPELEYLFRHALIQDAAYESLLRADRKRLHLQVGEGLERTYPDRLAELAPLLAPHFDLGGDPVRALRYFTLAGDEAARLYANVEAIQHYTHALALIQQLTSPPPAATLIHLYISLGMALELNSQIEAAFVYYVELSALSQTHNDQRMELAALLARAKLHSAPTIKFDPAQAEALLTRAQAIAHALADYAAEADIYWNLLLLKKNTNDLEQAIVYAERGQAIARQHNLRERLAFILNDLGGTYANQNQLEASRAMLEEARVLWRELGNQPMLADNLGNSAITYFLLGDYAQALTVSAEAYTVSAAIGNLWGQAFSRAASVYLYFERGEPGTAIETMEDSVGLVLRSGLQLVKAAVQADLAWMYAATGAFDRARVWADQARAVLSPALPPLFRTWAYAHLARYEIACGHLDQAERDHAAVADSFQIENLGWVASFGLFIGAVELALARQDYPRAIATADQLLARLKKFHVRPYVAETIYLQAQAYRALGDHASAQSLLAEAQTIAESMAARRALWLIHTARAELAVEHGETAQAIFHRAQVREIIHLIAANCPPDLRESFLNQPSVRVITAANLS
jgi:tetratricopeptide (TPR) repeat protein